MIASTLLLLSSLLTQATPTQAAPKERPAPPPSTSALPTVQVPPGDVPVMSWYRDVKCTDLAPSRAVPSGRYRVQCDELNHLCLASSRNTLGPDGVETHERLPRTDTCHADPELGAQLAQQGYRFLFAIAEAPPGFARDERGRLIQASFDLNSRLYLGVALAPVYTRLLQTWETTRMRVEFGIQHEWPGERSSGPARHRIRVLEGALHLGPEESIEGVLFHYDDSVERVTPIRLTSVVGGQPHRGDLKLNLGIYVDVARWESIKRAGVANSFLTWGALEGTLDVWHSADLTSYVRLRLGAGVETDMFRHFTQAKPQAALDADFTLDASGLHHLRLGAEAEKLYLGPSVPGRPVNPERLRVRAGYELVLFALNDRPFTFTLEGRGTWRDDLPEVPPGWEWAIQAGLRFSFWVGPRTADDDNR